MAVDGRESFVAALRLSAESDPVELVTAPHLAASLGVGAIAALESQMREQYPAIAFRLWVDCREDAGVAMAALRVGLHHVIFRGGDEVAAKLEGMAIQLGGACRRD